MNKKKFDINYKLKIIPSPPRNQLMIWLSRPNTIEGQEIESFEMNIKNTSEYKDGENTVLYLADDIEESFNLNVSIAATLSKGSENIPTSLGDESSPNYEEFIKDEKYTEISKDIRLLTESVISESDSRIVKLKKIFHFVVQNFSYEYRVKNRGVKFLDLNNLKGDCSEYSSLFVSMCRSQGIMARNVTGFVIFEDENSIVEHGWAQVFTKELGWVDIDTQYASLEKTLEIGENKYFLNRSEYRLITCVGFNIPLRPQIPEKFSVKTINELGIETNRTYAQTLQPIVFATSTSESIRVKQNLTIDSHTGTNI